MAWVDVYDPAANTWTRLADMPHARDHFHAAVVDGTLYAIGGRQAKINATIPQVDAYDLAAGAWSTRDTPSPPNGAGSPRRSSTRRW